MRAWSYLAWALGVVAIVGSGVGPDELLVLLAPAGAIIVTLGTIGLRDRGDLLERISASARKTRSWQLNGQAHFTRFHAVLAVVIGIGWMAGGLAKAVALAT